MNAYIYTFLLLLWPAVQIAAQQTDLPDFRTKKESVLKVSDKPLRSDLTSFTLAGIEESIGKAPLRKISPATIEKNKLRFNTEGLEVIVETGPFEPNGKKLQFMEKALVKINNKPYYGNYGETPATEIKKISITWGNDTISIPPTTYADLYNLNFTYLDKAKTERTGNAIYFSGDGSRFYLYLLSRDNAGSYEVTWVIENKKFLRRVFDYGFTL